MDDLVSVRPEYQEQARIMDDRIQSFARQCKILGGLTGRDAIRQAMVVDSMHRDLRNTYRSLLNLLD